MNTRAISEESAKALRAGADHYTCFVGPPTEYDFMGATQFALLFSLGIRETDRILDFGCGSLRAGRLLIPFLQPGNYYGIEPEAWLIEEAIERQIGRDMIRIKKPVFSHSGSFSADVFDETFDFIVAQSIFSHAGPDIAANALKSFTRALRPHGICAVTFIEGETDTPAGWHYPRNISYRRELIDSIVAAAGLVGFPIPWYHPKQVWWLLARDQTDLPSAAQAAGLTGLTLRLPPPRRRDGAQPAAADADPIKKNRRKARLERKARRANAARVQAAGGIVARAWQAVRSYITRR